MPEGPEIRYEFDKIHKIQGMKMTELVGVSHKLPLPLKITEVGVKGKLVWWLFENGDGMVVSHGMTGGWIWDEEGGREYSGRWFQPKHNRVRFKFEKGPLLYFNDMRRFGKVVIGSKEMVMRKVEALGPSVLERPTYQAFWGNFKPSSRPIGVLLMDQGLVSGIGNYLRADILWLARVSPWKKFQHLTEKEKKDIWKASVRHALYHYNFMKKYGEIYPEGREKTFLVYGKKKDPNGLEVVAEKMGSRTIHWVPGWQEG